MCLHCNKFITKSNLISSLKSELNAENFESYNTTSVEFILYACFGLHGDEAKNLAMDVLEKFIDWMCRNKRPYYMPTSGLIEMYHPLMLKLLLNDARNMPINFVLNDDELLYKINNYKSTIDKHNRQICKLNFCSFFNHLNFYVFGIIIGGITTGIVLSYNI